MPENGRTTVDNRSPLPDSCSGSPAEPADQTQRVRHSADAFAFNALLNGVVRAPEPDEADRVPAERGNPDQPLRGMEPPALGSSSTAPVLARSSARSTMPGDPVTSAPDRRWLWAILLMATLAGTAASLVVQVALPRLKSKSASPPPAIALNPLVMRGLPDAKLTPGELGPHTGTINPYVRLTVLRDYGISPADGRFVICTLIPKSLGGSNSPANLFPTTRWFANLKTRVDKSLTAQVIAGGITADVAIADLRANWVKAAHHNYVRNYGQRDPAKAKTAEDRLNW